MAKAPAPPAPAPKLDPKVAKAIATALDMRKAAPPVQTALGKWKPKA